MTPPALRLTKPTLSVASSNYINSEIESLNTLRLSTSTNRGGSLNVDAGVDVNITTSDNGLQTTVKPAFEAKYKQNITSVPFFDSSLNLRTYARYRKIGDMNQLRLAAGGSVPINDNLSVYADAHYTTKFEENKDKIGCWTGLDYKVNNNFSLWCELQANKTINGSSDMSGNVGLSYRF